MSGFHYQNGELYGDKVEVRRIAEEVGTPFYLYSYDKLVENYRTFDNAFKEVPHLICYALKANSNSTICRILAKEGSGADIVSGGELYIALKAGIPSGKIVYAGNGKTKEEIRYALEADILMVNVDSLPELKVVDEVAKELKRKARIALRVNPDIDPKTHHYIATGLKKSKFGIPIKQALDSYLLANNLENLEILGIHMHIGSQITEVGPYVDSLQKVVDLVGELKSKGINLKYIDIGGGLGITYKDERPASPDKLAQTLIPLLKGTNSTLIVEPGRYIVGNSGLLVTKVLYRKETEVKKFLVVDAAMNDLIRPSLYDSYHEILPVAKREGRVGIFDIVGPVCESGDFLAKEREMPEVKPNELLAIFNAGAYGYAMSSNYNARPRLPEVMVKSDRYYTVRRRESYEDLVAKEEIPEGL